MADVLVIDCNLFYSSVISVMNILYSSNFSLSRRTLILRIIIDNYMYQSTDAAILIHVPISKRKIWTNLISFFLTC